jgi:hypothetical protein
MYDHDHAAAAMARRVRLHGLAALTSDVIAQALGTMLAGGLLYVGAAALGMVAISSVRAVVLVALVCGTPLVAGAALVRRVNGWRHSRGDSSRLTCPICGRPTTSPDPVRPD